MEKNKPRCVLLGVQKRKKFTKENRLVKKVVDYLKSNCYMFAPVLSSPPSHFGSPNISISSSTGMKVRGTSKGRKKGLLKKVGDYLKSDSYFYSSIVDPQPRPPTVHTGCPFICVRGLGTCNVCWMDLCCATIVAQEHSTTMS